MTREEAIGYLYDIKTDAIYQVTTEEKEALNMVIKALEQEQKPMEKFESAKDHIYKLAGDYKCWDNRLTDDEALELYHILEQQPCEDAISRQAAIDAMCALCNTGETLKENPWRDNPHIDAIIDALDTLPPVTPQPKTGHWYRKHSWEICFTCSECGTTNASGTKYNYCPSCGVRMAEREG